MLKRPQVGSKRPHSDDLSDGTDWGSLRLFVMLAASLSFRAVARDTGHTVRTVRTRIAAFERSLNARLVKRHSTGVALTEEGELVLEAAEDALRSMGRIRRITRHKSGIRASVRIGVTEGIATYWLMPRLADFVRAHPHINVKMRCRFDAANVVANNSDVAIHLQKPTIPTVKVRRIARLHLVFFASQKYLEENGVPHTRADLAAHHMIEADAPQLIADELHEQIIGEDERYFGCVTTDTSSTQAMGAKYGVGIAMLPTYAVAITDNLVHVVPDERLKIDVWLSYDPQASKLPGVQAAMKWLVGAFDRSKYPWFSDHYISPAELERFMDNTGTKRMFASAQDF